MWVKLADDSYRPLSSYVVLKAYSSGGNYVIGNGNSADNLAGTYPSLVDAQAALDVLMNHLGLVTP